MTDGGPFTPRQNNTGLYMQLRAVGFGVPDILEVQQAYRTACRLFNGRYRKTERVFICHAVGVASSVARFDQGLDLIVAGMLHAAYDSGLYPDGRIGRATSGHRAWLREQVGSAVEGLVERYNRFEFGKGVPEQLAAGDGQAMDQECLLLALCHEIDDMADGGLIFAPKYGLSIQSRVDACVSLAEQLARPSLAACLRAHGREYTDLAWTEPLRSWTLEGFRIVPGASGYFRWRYDALRSRGVDVH